MPRQLRRPCKKCGTSWALGTRFRCRLPLVMISPATEKAAVQRTLERRLQGRRPSCNLGTGFRRPSKRTVTAQAAAAARHLGHHHQGLQSAHGPRRWWTAGARCPLPPRLSASGGDPPMRRSDPRPRSLLRQQGAGPRGFGGAGVVETLSRQSQRRLPLHRGRALSGPSCGRGVGCPLRSASHRRPSEFRRPRTTPGGGPGGRVPSAPSWARGASCPPQCASRRRPLDCQRPPAGAGDPLVTSSALGSSCPRRSGSWGARRSARIQPNHNS
mmetsp:Transcript_95811/g.243531  ORF Transcript_95811/g.243531 Transcript_95811/m.243531 type:complete len:271 (+) Transcript_95811:235-1047(+)